MKIIWLTTRFPPDPGGMACSAQRLVNSLTDNEHHVNVLHLTQSTQRNIPDNQNRVITIAENSLGALEKVFWQHQDLFQDALFVGFGGNIAGYLAVLWARWLHKRSVVLFRGNDFDRLIHNPKRAWITHFILEQAAGIGAVSNEMVHRIQTLRTGLTKFTPNSIDLTEWTFLDRDLSLAAQWRQDHVLNDRPVVGMFGELKYKKGLDLALQLFTSFEFRKRAYLLTVGKVSDFMQEQLAEQCPAAWLSVPFQKKEQLPVYYAASDIVFLPSYFDGMPNVLLESLALSKVVVASRAGAFPDVISDGETGFLFRTGDAADAARALNQALSLSATQKQKMQNAARNIIAQNYTPEREVEVLMQLLVNQ
ncbi:glycosyltransferase family 4 protein [candidate division CSSED10-310 bacterium]|uniref:Glycosyltransferase family 4 protein n=1 Tax=candidate division CSSED10-310 bacterium TaxID=2855610 RepID=A0ABV6YUE5_UNCC1